MELMTSASLATPAALLALSVLLLTALAGYWISLALFEWHTTPLRKPASKIAGLLVLAPAILGLAVGLV
jgi:hypothetical protein